MIDLDIFVFMYVYNIYVRTDICMHIYKYAEKVWEPQP